MSRPPQPDFNKVINEARKHMKGFGNLGSLPWFLGFVGIGSYTLYNSIYFVPGGHRAVKFNAITGLHDQAYGEGANLAIPYIETPILFDIRSRPTEVTSASGSRDLQTINMSVRVLYKPHVEKLYEVYRRLGVNFGETVLPSLINEVMRAVIAQYNASELLVKRAEVSHKIGQTLRARANHFNIDISDVSITQMTFGKEYSAAVEAKQIAQQKAEQAKFTVDQAIQEKNGMILLAEGEAQAAQLIGNATKNNPGFMELRKVEAARTIAKTVAQGKGKYYIDSDALLLNVGDTNGFSQKK